MGRDTSSYILYRKNEKERMRDSGYTKSKGNCKSNVCTENYIFYLRLRIKLPYVAEWKQNKKKAKKKGGFISQDARRILFFRIENVYVCDMYMCVLLLYVDRRSI